ncbi:MAG: M14 family metallopeptidase [Candidatus Latescibacterota bacterium]
MPTRPGLPKLPFDHYLTYQEVTAFLEELAARRPALCRLGSLGESREGRPIPLLSVSDFGSGDPDDRPAYLVHGNIHASELAGTHAALYTARQLLADQPEVLERVTFHLVPRLNPDGAEFAVTTGGRIRSRTDTSQREPNTLYMADVNGDGLVLSMRQQHPNGGFARDPEDPRLMVQRRFDTPGPFYRVLPEGHIHQWDGSEAIRQGGRSFDWNRNWSYDWRPEPEQGGAGDFPFSEVEMHHLAQFVHRHPSLFGVLGYHTGPAAVLRPPSTGADAALDEGDLRVMEDLAQIGAQETGFPVIPVVKYRLERSRDIELRGHFHDFGYRHLGLFVFEFELGNVLNSAGLSTAEQFQVRTPQDSEAQMRQVLRWWDRRRRRPALMVPWRPFQHPQLGRVEIGGFLSPHLANPTLEDLRGTVRGTHRFTLAHAARHPRIVVEDLACDSVAPQMWRIRCRIANRGGLPTHVTQRGRSLSRLRPVRVALDLAEGVSVLSQEACFDLGHLAEATGSRQVEWFVRGPQGRLGEVRAQGGTGGVARQAVAGT